VACGVEVSAMHVEVLQADITTLDVDARRNPGK
jgi:hypothetical protein